MCFVVFKRKSHQRPYRSCQTEAREALRTEAEVTSQEAITEMDGCVAVSAVPDRCGWGQMETNQPEGWMQLAKEKGREKMGVSFVGSEVKPRLPLKLSGL